jgi:hypothetical protein
MRRFWLAPISLLLVACSAIGGAVPSPPPIPEPPGGWVSVGGLASTSEQGRTSLAGITLTGDPVGVHVLCAPGARLVVVLTPTSADGNPTSLGTAATFDCAGDPGPLGAVEERAQIDALSGTFTATAYLAPPFGSGETAFSFSIEQPSRGAT